MVGPYENMTRFLRGNRVLFPYFVLYTGCCKFATLGSEEWNIYSNFFHHFYLSDFFHLWLTLQISNVCLERVKALLHKRDATKFPSSAYEKILSNWGLKLIKQDPSLTTVRALRESNHNLLFAWHMYCMCRETLYILFFYTICSLEWWEIWARTRMMHT